MGDEAYDSVDRRGVDQRLDGDDERDVATAALKSRMLKWTIGALVGTLLIAVTSPWFVRTYEPLHPDDVRGVWTLAPGVPYRWRSEGYATTAIGPHGMPGRTSLGHADADDPSGSKVRVALWGDSQVEGVCVADELKLFSQCERVSNDKMAFLPLARSGEDASDWAQQMSQVESAFDLDAHVVFVVELSDIAAAVNEPAAPPAPSDAIATRSAIASWAPAFVIQAARNTLYEADESTRRQLRFRIGPTVQVPPITNAESSANQTPFDWAQPLQVIRDASDLPIIIAYAPQRPQIVGGELIREDLSATAFAEMKPTAESLGMTIVNVGSELLASADVGQWPHGFHNGQIGVGHLNARGYAVVAPQIVKAVETAIGE